MAGRTPFRVSGKPASANPDLQVKEIRRSMPSASRLRLTLKPAPPMMKPDKENDMYPLLWPPYNHGDVQQRMEAVLGPLSLFAPYSHEDDIMNDVEETLPEPDTDSLDLQRPVTPINNEIKEHPMDFHQLAQFVRRRIAARPDIPHMSIPDQQNLAGILMGEVNGVWPEMRKQQADPFLSPTENKELNRRIAVHIVTVCEWLFNHYIEKAKILNSRGVFSGPANMTRLKAQLALEANKFLDILTIRRHLVQDMRKRDVSEVDSDLDSILTAPPEKQKKPLSYSLLIQSSRPKSTNRRFRAHTLENEIKDLKAQMPNLDTSKLLEIVTELPERPLKTPSDEDGGFRKKFGKNISSSTSMNDGEASRYKVLHKRTKSEPDLRNAEALMEELGVTPASRRDPLMTQELEILRRERAEIHRNARDDPNKLTPGSREYAAEDLRQLVQGKKEKEEEKAVEEDLAPLLQAITRHARHDGLKERMARKLKELEERERAREEARKVSLRGPRHPQPATINSKLPNQMLVKASDIRVSDRICMSSITLDRFSTVYNDLLEELDPATVKMLDKSLFLSEEINEVYKEIMRASPKDHLELDSDSMVMSAVSELEVTGTMASASLSKSRAQRVLNPNLCPPEADAPWGEMDPHEWVKTPQDPPKNFAGDDVFAPMTPDMTRVNKVLNHKKVKAPDMPPYMAENLSRTYASWLQWWKGTITSDDYMKYLSTQESDYLGAVFHFYDADDDDMDAANMPQRTYSGVSQSTVLSPDQKEREEQVKKLLAVKEEYTPGMWNVNTITMGGLGQDPLLSEPEDSESIRDVKSAEKPRSAKTLQERTAQVQQAKLSSGKSRDTSRASKAATTLSAVTAADTEEKKEGDEWQKRMEKLWSVLQFPDNLKLDMAIKYSTNAYFHLLPKAMKKWETVTELILQREATLSRLEAFERKASDPNRFFEKGGKSRDRLEEERKRNHYHRQLAELDTKIESYLNHLKDKYKDVVTFKGRPYVDKMKWDRVEMMFWLSEERKQNAIKYEMVQQAPLPLKTAFLDPIPTLK